MTHKKRIALAALALVTLAGASPALAQFWPPPAPEPDEYAQPRYRYRYEQPRYRYRDDEQRYYRRRAEAGYTCATSRGSCDIGGQPIGSICRCFIPGFGPKRGYTQ
jgi:hypothetical protein